MGGEGEREGVCVCVRGDRERRARFNCGRCVKSSSVYSLL